MNRYHPLFLVVLLLILARWLSGFCGASCWGFNHLHYLSLPAGLLWSLIGVALLLAPLTRRSMFEGLSKPDRPLPAWSVGILFLILALLLPGVATPLGGDGVDRVSATVGGWKALQGQPAPLDFVIHILAYKLPVWTQESWTRSWRSWQAVSIAGGVAACVFTWKLASWRAYNKSERWFVFFTIFATGTVVFFFGYAENYVLPAAGMYGFLVLMEAVRQDKAPGWTLFAAMALLAALHFFLAILIPPALYVMYRYRLARLKLWSLTIVLLFLIAFGSLAFFMVEEHYRGLGAIFVSGENVLSSYHLKGFFNQQILACPALPLLLPLALIARPSAGDPLQSFCFLGSILFAVFFFFLRPVIGPAADWDLFAMPSLVYTPWMALRIHQSFRQKTVFRTAAWAVLVLLVVSTGPWFSVNAEEESSIKRYREIMNEEAKHNTWAASYGYYRLAGYLFHEKREPNKVHAALEKAIEINPDSATLRLQVADLFNKTGEKERAEKHLYHYYRLLAGKSLQQEKPEEAAQRLEKALGYSPPEKKPQLWRKLIEIYEGPYPRTDKARRYREKLDSWQDAKNK